VNTVPLTAAGTDLSGNSALPAEQAAAGCPVCGCRPAGPHPGLPPGPLGLLLAWLAGNYCRPGLRAGEMAAAAGVSVRRLQVLCQREWGRTPFRLLAEIRLHRARLALTSSVPALCSVAEVARSAGFTRVSRFRAAYLDRYGVPPAITLRDAQVGDLPGLAGTAIRCRQQESAGSDHAIVLPAISMTRAAAAAPASGAPRAGTS
jgi:AraC-like DNA-binding protein